EPAPIPEPLGLLTPERLEVAPGRLLAPTLALAERLRRAIGVVEPDDVGLQLRVGAAQARRVLGVALGLGGATLVRLDQETDRLTVMPHRRRVVQRHAGHDVLRRLAEGEDVLRRPPQAARE